MPVPLLWEALAMPEPPPSWFWSVMLFGPDGLVIPSARITNGNAPFYQLGVDTIMLENKPLSIPQGLTIEPLHFTFYESFTWVMARQIETWRKKACDNSGNYGIPIEYMGTALFMFQDSMGIPQFMFQVDGVWPTGISPLNLSYEGSSGFTVDTSFQVYRQFGQISLFGTLEDLGSEALGALGIDTSSLTGVTGLAETGLTGLL